MIHNIKIEVCCGSLEDVRTACAFDIDRIELNSALELGGLTPSIGTLIQARQITSKPICCMVRPRGAGFLYTEEQYLSMLFDAELLLKHSADGIVFGFLNQDNTINKDRTQHMVRVIHAYGKEAVFHKAFDLCPDKTEAIKTLIHCGVDRVLTAGGTGAITEQLDVLHQLQDRYSDRIQILPGGGVRSYNVSKILHDSACTQIHMSAREKAEDNGLYDAVSSAVLSDILSSVFAQGSSSR